MILIFFSFLFTKIYTFSLEDFFYYFIIFPYNSIAKFKIKHCFKYLGGNDTFIIFWHSLSFFEDKNKIFLPTDTSLFNGVR